jgi:hypothetical protein
MSTDENLPAELPDNDSSDHKKVLRNLETLIVPGHVIWVEEKGGRLDLPNPHFASRQKLPGQRGRGLCYSDSLVHSPDRLRIVIELVDKSPRPPNGITGLTINVDRIAEIHVGIKLLFVVLAEMKDFFCKEHGRGHRLSNGNTFRCLSRSLGTAPNEEACRAIIHEGKAANFRKALIDYPISKYLLNTPPPSVLFLNAARVAKEWDKYESHALQLIFAEIEYLLTSPEREPGRWNVRELMPKVSSSEPGPVNDYSRPPSPKTAVLWKSPTGHESVTIKNRGRHNTRVRFADGHTRKVLNSELVW